MTTGSGEHDTDQRVADLMRRKPQERAIPGRCHERTEREIVQQSATRRVGLNSQPMPRTERQHYVPAFYLSQWATPQERTGTLKVFDRETGRSRPSTPDSSAFVRDFYTLDLRDAPQAAEDALAKLEGLCSTAIAAVNADSAIPPDDEMRPLLAFVAIQATRTPRVRSNMAAFYNDVHMLVLHTLVENDEAFATHMRTVEPGITDAAIDKERAAARALLDNPKTRVVMDKNTLVRDFLDVAKDLEDVLYGRYWQLCVAPSDTSFVTSDDPVLLDFADGRPPTFLNAPGFGRADTVVSLVLGPRYLLVGRAVPASARRREVTTRAVAAYNTRAIFNAARFVYFGGEQFDFIGPDNTLASGPAEVLQSGTNDPEGDENR